MSENKQFKISGTFEIIVEDEYGEENAVEEVMDNILNFRDEYDDYFISAEFEYADSEMILDKKRS